MSRIRTVAVTTALLVTAGLIGAGVALAADSVGNGGADAAGSGASPAAVSSPVAMQGTFTPITPCRIIDTRAAGGQFAAGATRSFLVRGTAGFEAQGGTAGGCGIPESATAIMVSVSSVNIGGTGYFRAWPYGGSVPNATIAHYEAGPITTTGGTMTLSTGPQAYDISIRAYAAPASVVVDVTGYFAPQMAAFVQQDGTLTFATPRVTASTRTAMGNYTVTFDTDVSRCAFQVTPYAYNWIVAVGPRAGNVDQAVVYIHDQGADTDPHDTSFFITATC